MPAKSLLIKTISSILVATVLMTSSVAYGDPPVLFESLTKSNFNLGLQKDGNLFLPNSAQIAAQGQVSIEPQAASYKHQAIKHSARSLKPVTKKSRSELRANKRKNKERREVKRQESTEKSNFQNRRQFLISAASAAGALGLIAFLVNFGGHESDDLANQRVFAIYGEHHIANQESLELLKKQVGEIIKKVGAQKIIIVKETGWQSYPPEMIMPLVVKRYPNLPNFRNIYFDQILTTYSKEIQETIDWLNGASMSAVHRDKKKYLDLLIQTSPLKWSVEEAKLIRERFVEGADLDLEGVDGESWIYWYQGEEWYYIAKDYLLKGDFENFKSAAAEVVKFYGKSIATRDRKYAEKIKQILKDNPGKVVIFHRGFQHHVFHSNLEKAGEPILAYSDAINAVDESIKLAGFSQQIPDDIAFKFFFYHFIDQELQKRSVYPQTRRKHIEFQAMMDNFDKQGGTPQVLGNLTKLLQSKQPADEIILLKFLHESGILTEYAWREWFNSGRSELRNLESLPQDIDRVSARVLTGGEGRAAPEHRFDLGSSGTVGLQSPSTSSSVKSELRAVSVGQDDFVGLVPAQDAALTKPATIQPNKTDVSSIVVLGQKLKKVMLTQSLMNEYPEQILELAMKYSGDTIFTIERDILQQGRLKFDPDFSIAFRSEDGNGKPVAFLMAYPITSQMLAQKMAGYEQTNGEKAIYLSKLRVADEFKLTPFGLYLLLQVFSKALESDYQFAYWRVSQTESAEGPMRFYNKLMKEGIIEEIVKLPPDPTADVKGIAHLGFKVDIRKFISRLDFIVSRFEDTSSEKVASSRSELRQSDRIDTAPASLATLAMSELRSFEPSGLIDPALGVEIARGIFVWKPIIYAILLEMYGFENESQPYEILALPGVPDAMQNQSYFTFLELIRHNAPDIYRQLKPETKKDDGRIALNNAIASDAPVKIWLPEDVLLEPGADTEFKNKIYVAALGNDARFLLGEYSAVAMRRMDDVMPSGLSDDEMFDWLDSIENKIEAVLKYDQANGLESDLKVYEEALQEENLEPDFRERLLKEFDDAKKRLKRFREHIDFWKNDLPQIYRQIVENHESHIGHLPRSFHDAAAAKSELRNENSGNPKKESVADAKRRLLREAQELGRQFGSTEPGQSRAIAGMEYARKVAELVAFLEKNGPDGNGRKDPWVMPLVEPDYAEKGDWIRDGDGGLAMVAGVSKKSMTIRRFGGTGEPEELTRTDIAGMRRSSTPFLLLLGLAKGRVDEIVTPEDNSMEDDEVEEIDDDELYQDPTDQDQDANDMQLPPAERIDPKKPGTSKRGRKSKLNAENVGRAIQNIIDRQILAGRTGAFAITHEQLGEALKKNGVNVSRPTVDYFFSGGKHEDLRIKMRGILPQTNAQSGYELTRDDVRYAIQDIIDGRKKPGQIGPFTITIGELWDQLQANAVDVSSEAVHEFFAGGKNADLAQKMVLINLQDFTTPESSSGQKKRKPYQSKFTPEMVSAAIDAIAADVISSGKTGTHQISPNHIVNYLNQTGTKVSPPPVYGFFKKPENADLKAKLTVTIPASGTGTKQTQSNVDPSNAGAVQPSRGKSGDGKVQTAIKASGADTGITRFHGALHAGMLSWSQSYAELLVKWFGEEAAPYLEYVKSRDFSEALRRLIFNLPEQPDQIAPSKSISKSPDSKSELRQSVEAGFYITKVGNVLFNPPLFVAVQELLMIYGRVRQGTGTHDTLMRDAVDLKINRKEFPSVMKKILKNHLTPLHKNRHGEMVRIYLSKALELGNQSWEEIEKSFALFHAFTLDDERNLGGVIQMFLAFRKETGRMEAILMYPRASERPVVAYDVAFAREWRAQREAGQQSVSRRDKRNDPIVSQLAALLHGGPEDHIFYRKGFAQVGDDAPSEATHLDSEGSGRFLNDVARSARSPAIYAVVVKSGLTKRELVQALEYARYSEGHRPSNATIFVRTLTLSDYTHGRLNMADQNLALHIENLFHPKLKDKTPIGILTITPASEAVRSDYDLWIESETLKMLEAESGNQIIIHDQIRKLWQNPVKSKHRRNDYGGGIYATHFSGGSGSSAGSKGLYYKVFEEQKVVVVLGYYHQDDLERGKRANLTLRALSQMDLETIRNHHIAASSNIAEFLAKLRLHRAVGGAPSQRSELRAAEQLHRALHSIENGEAVWTEEFQGHRSQDRFISNSRTKGAPINSQLFLQSDPSRSELRDEEILNRREFFNESLGAAMAALFGFGSLAFAGPKQKSKPKKKNVKKPKAEILDYEAFRKAQIERMLGYLKPGVGVDPKSGYAYDGLNGDEARKWTQPTIIGFQVEILAHQAAGDVPGRENAEHAKEALATLDRLLKQLLQDQKKFGRQVAPRGNTGLIPWFKLEPAVQADSALIAYVDNANLTVSVMTAIGSLIRAKKIHPELSADFDQAIAQARQFLKVQEAGMGYTKMIGFQNGLLRGEVFAGEQGWRPDAYHIDRLFAEHGPKTALLTTYFIKLVPQVFTNLKPVFKPYKFRDGKERLVAAPWNGGAFQMGWAVPYVMKNKRFKIVYENFLKAAMDYAYQNGLPGFLSESVDPATEKYEGKIGFPFHETDEPTNYTISSLYGLDGFSLLAPKTILNWRASILKQLNKLVGPYGNFESATADGQVSKIYVGNHHLSSILGLIGKQSESIQVFLEAEGLTEKYNAFLDQVQLPDEAVKRFDIKFTKPPTLQRSELRAETVKPEDISLEGYALEGVSPDQIMAILKAGGEAFRESYTKSERKWLGENPGALAEIAGVNAVAVFGDLHGATENFTKRFEEFGKEAFLQNPKNHMVAIGDYLHTIDREKARDRKAYLESLRTLLILLQLKIKYPKQVHLLPGNHDYAHAGGARLEKFGLNQVGFLEFAIQSFVDLGPEPANGLDRNTVYSFLLNYLAYAVRQMPIVLTIAGERGHKVAFVHAGPNQSYTSKTEINEIKILHGTIDDVLWDRIYEREFLEQFLSTLESEYLISGHTPPNDFEEVNLYDAETHTAFINDRHVIIDSSRKPGMLLVRFADSEAFQTIEKFIRSFAQPVFPAGQQPKSRSELRDLRGVNDLIGEEIEVWAPSRGSTSNRHTLEDKLDFGVDSKLRLLAGRQRWTDLDAELISTRIAYTNHVLHGMQPNGLMARYKIIRANPKTQRERAAFHAEQVKKRSQYFFRSMKILGELKAVQHANVPTGVLNNPFTRASHKFKLRAWTSAIRTLGQMQARKYVPLIARYLDEGDPYLRATSARALGVMKTKRYLKRLIKMSEEDNSKTVREAAALAVNDIQRAGKNAATQRRSELRQSFRQSAQNIEAGPSTGAKSELRASSAKRASPSRVIASELLKRLLVLGFAVLSLYGFYHILLDSMFRPNDPPSIRHWLMAVIGGAVVIFQLIFGKFYDDMPITRLVKARMAYSEAVTNELMAKISERGIDIQYIIQQAVKESAGLDAIVRAGDYKLSVKQRYDALIQIINEAKKFDAQLTSISKKLAGVLDSDSRLEDVKQTWAQFDREFNTWINQGRSELRSELRARLINPAQDKNKVKWTSFGSFVGASLVFLVGASFILFVLHDLSSQPFSFGYLLSILPAIISFSFAREIFQERANMQKAGEALLQAIAEIDQETGHITRFPRKVYKAVLIDLISKDQLDLDGAAISRLAQFFVLLGAGTQNWPPNNRSRLWDKLAQYSHYDLLLQILSNRKEPYRLDFVESDIAGGRTLNLMNAIVDEKDHSASAIPSGDVLLDTFQFVAVPNTTARAAIGITQKRLLSIEQNAHRRFKSLLKSPRAALSPKIQNLLNRALRYPVSHAVKAVFDHADALGESYHGRLVLKAYRESGNIVIELSDNGSGIDFSDLHSALIRRLTTLAREAGSSSSDDSQDEAEFEVNLFRKVDGILTSETLDQEGRAWIVQQEIRNSQQVPSSEIRPGRRTTIGTTLRWVIPETNDGHREPSAPKRAELRSKDDRSKDDGDILGFFWQRINNKFASDWAIRKLRISYQNSAVQVRSYYDEGEKEEKDHDEFASDLDAANRLFDRIKLMSKIDQAAKPLRGKKLEGVFKETSGIEFHMEFMLDEESELGEYLTVTIGRSNYDASILPIPFRSELRAKDSKSKKANKNQLPWPDQALQAYSSALDLVSAFRHGGLRAKIDGQRSEIVLVELEKQWYRISLRSLHWMVPAILGFVANRPTLDSAYLVIDNRVESLLLSYQQKFPELKEFFDAVWEKLNPVEDLLTYYKNSSEAAAALEQVGQLLTSFDPAGVLKGESRSVLKKYGPLKADFLKLTRAIDEALQIISNNKPSNRSELRMQAAGDSEALQLMRSSIITLNDPSKFIEVDQLNLFRAYLKRFLKPIELKVALAAFASAVVMLWLNFGFLYAPGLLALSIGTILHFALQARIPEAHYWIPSVSKLRTSRGLTPEEFIPNAIDQKVPAYLDQPLVLHVEDKSDSKRIRDYVNAKRQFDTRYELVYVYSARLIENKFGFYPVLGILVLASNFFLTDALLPHANLTHDISLYEKYNPIWLQYMRNQISQQGDFFQSFFHNLSDRPWSVFSNIAVMSLNPFGFVLFALIPPALAAFYHKLSLSTHESLPFKQPEIEKKGWQVTKPLSAAMLAGFGLLQVYHHNLITAGISFSVFGYLYFLTSNPRQAFQRPIKELTLRRIKYPAILLMLAGFFAVNGSGFWKLYRNWNRETTWMAMAYLPLAFNDYAVNMFSLLMERSTTPEMSAGVIEPMFIKHGKRVLFQRVGANVAKWGDFKHKLVYYFDFKKVFQNYPGRRQDLIDFLYKRIDQFTFVIGKLLEGTLDPNHPQIFELTELLSDDLQYLKFARSALLRERQMLIETAYPFDLTDIDFKLRQIETLIGQAEESFQSLKSKNENKNDGRQTGGQPVKKLEQTRSELRSNPADSTAAPASLTTLAKSELRHLEQIKKELYDLREDVLLDRQVLWRRVKNFILGTPLAKYDERIGRLIRLLETSGELKDWDREWVRVKEIYQPFVLELMKQTTSIYFLERLSYLALLLGMNIWQIQHLRYQLYYMPWTQFILKKLMQERFTFNYISGGKPVYARNLLLDVMYRLVTFHLLILTALFLIKQQWLYGLIVALVTPFAHTALHLMVFNRFKRALEPHLTFPIESDESNESDGGMYFDNTERSELRNSDENTIQMTLDEAYEFLRSFVDREDNLQRTKPFAQEILKHQIDKILMAGNGLFYGHFLLALMGKKVTFVDRDPETVWKAKMLMQKINAHLKEEGRQEKLAVDLVVSEVGELDINQHHLLRGSYDLATFIDLLGGDPKGFPEKWLLKAQELLKPQGYVVIDENLSSVWGTGRHGELMVQDLKALFPNHELVSEEIFDGNWNRSRSRNRLYKVQNSNPMSWEEVQKKRARRSELRDSSSESLVSSLELIGKPETSNSRLKTETKAEPPSARAELRTDVKSNNVSWIELSEKIDQIISRARLEPGTLVVKMGQQPIVVGKIAGHRKIDFLPAYDKETPGLNVVQALNFNLAQGVIQGIESKGSAFDLLLMANIRDAGERGAVSFLYLKPSQNTHRQITKDRSIKKSRRSELRASITSIEIARPELLPEGIASNEIGAFVAQTVQDNPHLTTDNVSKTDVTFFGKPYELILKETDTDSNAFDFYLAAKQIVEAMKPVNLSSQQTAAFGELAVTSLVELQAKAKLQTAVTNGAQSVYTHQTELARALLRDQVYSSNPSTENTAPILLHDFTFGTGSPLLALAAAEQSGIAAVIATTDAEIAAVEPLQDQLANGKEIIVADTIEKARSELRKRGFKDYELFATENDVIPDAVKVWAQINRFSKARMSLLLSYIEEASNQIRSELRIAQAA